MEYEEYRFNMSYGRSKLLGRVMIQPACCGISILHSVGLFCYYDVENFKKEHNLQAFQAVEYSQFQKRKKEIQFEQFKYLSEALVRCMNSGVNAIPKDILLEVWGDTELTDERLTDNKLKYEFSKFFTKRAMIIMTDQVASPHGPSAVYRFTASDPKWEVSNIVRNPNTEGTDIATFTYNRLKNSAKCSTLEEYIKQTKHKYMSPIMGPGDL